MIETAGTVAAAVLDRTIRRQFQSGEQLAQKEIRPPVRNDQLPVLPDKTDTRPMRPIAFVHGCRVAAHTSGIARKGRNECRQAVQPFAHHFVIIAPVGIQSKLRMRCRLKHRRIIIESYANHRTRTVIKQGRVVAQSPVILHICHLCLTPRLQPIEKKAVHTGIDRFHPGETAGGKAQAESLGTNLISEIRR